MGLPKQLWKFRVPLKWVSFVLLLLGLYALQTTPGLFSVFGIKPVPILALAVCVSMYEGVVSSAMFAMTAGFLWDISSDKLFGFNGVILLCCGMMISLLCIYYLHTKMINSVLFCTAALVIQGLLDYLFNYALWNLEGSWILLVQHILPTAVYTVAITPLVFLLVRRMERCFSEADRG